ncbi:MAG: hypothetical protein N3A65_00150 [candidate division WOR-3 bacterium]|nr:hypothetical protein [candidate division WOR-3 bacterium]
MSLSTRYRSSYERVAQKHGRGTTRIAIARSMLKFNQPYQER